MEALKNYCKTQNICVICTIHQSNSEVTSIIDFLFILTKGGHNVFWGPTIELKQYLEVYGILTSDANLVPIETFVRLSAEGLRDIRLVNMKDNTRQVIINYIESSENNLFNQNIYNINKKFCYKDVIILFQREVTEVFRYKYKFYLMDAIISITTSVLITNTFGTDMGKYDDCFGLELNISCEERLNANNIERNANYMAFMLWVTSMIRVSLTIHDKLIKTKYFYHNRQNI